MLSVNGKIAAGIPAKTYLVVGDLMKILVSRQETNGVYVVVEVSTNPGGGMPLLHKHPAQETFYILAGHFEIYRQDDQGHKVAIPAGPGTAVHIPNNAPHGFANVGDTPGRLVLVFDGVGKMDEFFAEIGIPVEDENNLPVVAGPPDMEALLQVCARYNIAFLEGPPA